MNSISHRTIQSARERQKKIKLPKIADMNFAESEETSLLTFGFVWQRLHRPRSVQPIPRERVETPFAVNTILYMSREVNANTRRQSSLALLLAK
jgi:hypothetical protein